MDISLIIDLEKQLLNPELRKSEAKLGQLLSDDFVEFGASGRIIDKNEVLERLPKENPVHYEAFDFHAVQLANDVVQLRFKIRRSNDDGSISTSLRSSIWKRSADRWQMCFHQGTNTVF